MLVRTVAEPAGMNCASGGQKMQLGADVNGNGQLDDGEVQETRYVATGTALPGRQAQWEQRALPEIRAQQETTRQRLRPSENFWLRRSLRKQSSLATLFLRAIVR